MVLNEYDSVFANAKDAEDEFDVLFDQEDSLIDTVAGLKENGDPLTGNDGSSADEAEDRSTADENPDYEKEVDADDSKDAPKDAEGTEGYDFEDKPEVGKEDDQTNPGKEFSVDGEEKYQAEDVEYDFIDQNGSGCSAAEAEKRSCDDCNPDYEKDIDADDTKTAPKDAEGTEGYDFEDKPEVGKLDDQTKPGEDFEVEGEEKYQEEAAAVLSAFDEEDEMDDAEEITDDDEDFTAVMDAEDDDDAPTEVEDEKCGGGCKKESVEDIETGNGELEEDPLDVANPDLSAGGDDEYQEEAAEDIDKEVMDVAAPDGEDSEVDDAIVGDAEEVKDSDDAGLEYDFSDEEIIDELID